MIIEINKENFRAKEFQSLLKGAMKIQEAYFTDNKPDELTGFVVTKWSQEEWEKLITGGSSVFILKTGTEDVGAYMVVAPFEELETLLEETSPRVNIDFGQYSKNEWKYLYQTSVAPGLTRTGLGSLLCKESMRRAGAKGYFADYMILPWKNKASEIFLKQNGFDEYCQLTLQSYRNFPPTTWQIVRSI